MKVMTKGSKNAFEDGPTAPLWPSFRGESQFVGTSPSGKVTVFVDPSLGDEAFLNAQDLVADADRVVKANDAIFGSVGGSVDVIVFALHGKTDGTGGADHGGCDFVSGAAIEVCADFGRSNRVSALFEAELSECSMGGDLCGVSTGEALSRWCAATTSNNALADFATAPRWAAKGRPDFVNVTDRTDTNPISTGCGMAFISWMLSQGATLPAIARAMVNLGDTGTFTQVYANVVSNPVANPFPAFISAINSLPNGVTNDDPFAGTGVNSLARLNPDSAKLAGAIFGEILGAITAGRSAETIVANVKRILQSSTGSESQKFCSTKSHLLQPPKEN